MSQELVISSNPIETTVAVLENDRLVEIYVEHHASKAIAGSIYKGRVTRVLPGMQSSFVDLGLKRDAFLYVTDVLDPAERYGEELDADPIKAEKPKALPSADGRPATEGREAGEAKASAVAKTPGQADRSADGESTTPRRSRRRRRRRRSRRGGGRGKAATENEPAEQPKQEAERRKEPEQEMPVLLPGESLAKYSRGANQSGDRKGRNPAKGRRKREQVARSAQSGAESGRRSGSSGRRKSEAASNAAAESVPTNSAKRPAATTAAPAKSDSAPPRRTAEVSAPSTVAELRLGMLDWLRRKSKGPGEKPPQKPSAASKEKPAKAPPQRKPPQRPRPPRRAQRRPAARAQRAGQRRRPKRRPPASKTPRAIRPKKGGKTGRHQRGAQTRGPQADIKDLLKSGQELIVQVNKEPIGSKGARITSHVSLPGRYMVYMTTAKHNGVARKIQPESERNRLRKIVKKHSRSKPGGFVVRTAGRGVDEDALAADMEFLYKLWVSIQERAAKRKAPTRLHSDLDIVERVLRDNLGQSYKSIWVDSEDTYQRIVQFVERFQPALMHRVKLYTRQQPIHDSFGISRDLEKALKPKVWLKSGGYLVINQTEALVAIDVNTGRYVGKSNRLEDTVLKTNLEAAEEIVRQLRLRDLGGIIVIDFIDMEDRKNRQKVQQVLHDALRQTRSPSRLLPFNDFGLVVITRKAVRQSLERALCMPCPACSGAGTVKSSSTVLSEIFSAAGRFAAKSKKKGGNRHRELTLRVHPQIAKSLKKKSNSHLDDLEQAVGTSVLVRGDSSMHPEKFTLA